MRYSLNFARLPQAARQAAHDASLGEVCRNPFKSIVVRAVETVFACEEALAIIREYERPGLPCAAVPPGAGEGCAITEAPRGMLYHRYRLDADGRILDAVIVPPTAQNLKSVEGDLRKLVEQSLQLDDAALTARCEQAVRNYDPCISCATHFLTLHLDRK